MKKKIAEDNRKDCIKCKLHIESDGKLYCELRLFTVVKLTQSAIVEKVDCVWFKKILLDEN